MSASKIGLLAAITVLVLQGYAVFETNILSESLDGIQVFLVHILLDFAFLNMDIFDVDVSLSLLYNRFDYVFTLRCTAMGLRYGLWWSHLSCT